MSKILRALIVLFFILYLPLNALAASEGKTIRVGWVDNPGMSDFKNGKYSGYNYDYLMEIAKYTGWKYEFVTGKFPDIVAKLKKGEIDLHCSIPYTHELATELDYSERPSCFKNTCIVTTIDSPYQPHDFKDYNGIRIASLSSDTVSQEGLEHFAKAHGFTYTLKTYDDLISFAVSAHNGEVDAGLVDGYFPHKGFHLLAQFAPVPYYFATAKGNTEVLATLNNALYRLNIELPFLERSLYAKHLDIKYNTTLSIKEKELVNASKLKPIRIGVVDNSAPICFWNAEKKVFSGIIVDIMNTVAAKTGLQIEYIPVELNRATKTAHPTPSSPQLLLGAAYSSNISDKRGWFLSDSFYSGTLTAVGLRGVELNRNRTEKYVALMSNFAQAKNYVLQNMSDYKIKEYPSLEDCLQAVVEGNADVAVYLQSSISYLLQKPQYAQLEIIPSYSEKMDICMASFTKENYPLLNIVNKGLHMLTKDDSRTIAMNYMAKNPYKLTMMDILFKYRLPLIVIVLLILSVIIALLQLASVRRRSADKIKEALAVAKKASMAKGSFMTRMSHEIRTPLNAIIGYNTIARNEMTETKTDSQRRQAEMHVMDCLSKSDIASKHLLTIINDVLDMSAIESGKIRISNERFDFKGLIASLTAIFYSQAKAKGVDFEVRFASHMEEWIVGDQVRVNQILTNLLSNAVKFTPSGGKVTLFIQPQLLEKNVKLHFDIIDTGIGMSEEYLERLWEPFEQADSSISRRFGGTGLGLSITKTLIDLLHGTIAVKSKLGEGSVFSIELTFERTEQPQQTGPYDFSTINALVVDDDRSTCDYIGLLLTRNGVRSTEVTSGAEALNALSVALAKNEPYTVCLVDWYMPQMDGIETVKKMRKIAGDQLPIIVVTAYDFSEVADKAASLGVNMFISKPLFQSSLFNMLANISGSNSVSIVDQKSLYDFTGARVLLAEDNAMNMEIACKLLSSTGVTVEQVWNGQEAVDKFLSMPAGTYQAILMDIQMPVMDGYEATHCIRQSQHPEAANIPIIAMTADAFAENIAASFAAGMNDHISKPVDLPDMFKILAKYLKQNESNRSN